MRPEIKTFSVSRGWGGGRGAREASGTPTPHGALGLAPVRPGRVPRPAGTVGAERRGRRREDAGTRGRGLHAAFSRLPRGLPLRPPAEARAGHVRGRSAQRPRLSLRPAARGSRPRPPDPAQSPPLAGEHLWRGAAWSRGAGFLRARQKGRKVVPSRRFCGGIRRRRPGRRYIRRRRAWRRQFRRDREFANCRRRAAATSTW